MAPILQEGAHRSKVALVPEEDGLSGLAAQLPEAYTRFGGRYNLPPKIATPVIISSVLGVLIFLAVVLILQLAEERERLRHERFLANARRLRYKTTEKEVQPPKLVNEFRYHLFLSQ